MRRQTGARVGTFMVHAQTETLSSKEQASTSPTTWHWRLLCALCFAFCALRLLLALALALGVVLARLSLVAFDFRLLMRHMWLAACGFWIPVAQSCGFLLQQLLHSAQRIPVALVSCSSF
jgi:hypothetical protein